MGALQTNDVDRGSRRRVDIIDVSLGGFRSFSCRMRTVGIRPERVIAIHQESSSGSCTLGVLAGRQRCDDQVGSGHRNAPNVDGRRARRNSFLAPILVASSRPKLRRICCFSKALSHRVQRSGKIVTSAPTRMSARGRSSIESGLRRDYENGGRRTARSRSRIDARRRKGSAGRAASLVSPGPLARPCPAGRHARAGRLFSGTIPFRGAARCETSEAIPHKDATTTRNGIVTLTGLEGARR